jgi:hypothetical protein
VRIPRAVFALLAAVAAMNGAEPLIRVTIFGSVAKSGNHDLRREEATLSGILERAGGITASGSDHVRITVPIGNDQFRSWSIRGEDFYRGDLDFLLPEKATVIVLVCVEVGLGNLSREEFARLEENRRGYLKRQADGKVATRELLSMPRIDSPKTAKGERP